MLFLKSLDGLKLGRYAVFTSWALWNGLLQPPPHPLFYRLHKDSSTTGINTCMVLLLAAAPLLCCGLWGLLLPLRAASVTPVLVAIVFFSSSVYISAWIIDISRTIATQHRNRTYDLLCAAPAGAPGVSQAICAASLHRDERLTWVIFLRRLMTGLLLFILLMILLVTAATSRDTFDLPQLLRLLLDILLLATAFYIDHIQAIVMGCLVGMLTPARSRSRPETPFLAVGGFLILQIIIFSISLLAITGLLSLPTVNWWSGIILLAFFYLIREMVNVALWRMLVYQLNAGPTDFRVGV